MPLLHRGTGKRRPKEEKSIMPKFGPMKLFISLLLMTKKPYELDTAEQLNPRPHVVAVDLENDRLLKRNYGQIPFYRFSNNEKEDDRP